MNTHVCGSCGQDAKPDATFCHRCGTRLDAPPVSARPSDSTASTTPAPVGPRWRPSRRVVIALTAGCTFLLSAALVASALTRMPALTGDAESISKTLSEAGLPEAHIEYVANATPIGKILSQEPAAGAITRRSTKVTVRVAGYRPVEMPDLSGMTAEKAKAELAKRGLQNVDVVEREEELVLYGGPAEGTVIEQSPPPHSSANDGVGTSLTVAKAPVRRDKPTSPHPSSLEYQAIKALIEGKAQEKGGAVRLIVSDGYEALVLIAEWFSSEPGEACYLRHIAEEPYWTIAAAGQDDGEGGGPGISYIPDTWGSDRLRAEFKLRAGRWTH